MIIQLEPKITEQAKSKLLEKIKETGVSGNKPEEWPGNAGWAFANEFFLTRSIGRPILQRFV